MNNLTYITAERAATRIAAGETIPDGTMITAHCASIEGPHPWLDIVAIERHIDGQWQKVWTDGVYHYQMLVARGGIEQHGKFEDGFRVSGTEKGVW